MADLSDWSVLIVEDEVDAQNILIPLLHQHNINTSTALTGEEALEKLRQELPTLAIVDLALPGMDGWQLLQAMRSDSLLVNVPAVAITAYYSTNVAQEAIEAGFIAFFPKPINARTFVHDLVNALALC